MADLSNHKTKKISRRDFLKITAVAGLTVGLGSSFGIKILMSDGLQRVTSTQYLMGTIVNFNILTPDHAMGEEALRRTVTEMERLIKIFDYRQAGATLRQLNQAGTLNDAPIELIDVIQQSLQLGMLTRGAFDITVLPMLEAFKAGQVHTDHLLDLIDYRNVVLDGTQIDFTRPGMSITLDGIAKGRIVDAGVEVLKNMGFGNVLVEAGGDMMTNNSDLDGAAWTIAITSPRPSADADYITTVAVKNQAVTTSGDYMNRFSQDYSRYHIIDPRTGISPSELASATVIASNATWADALSTSLMVLGVRNGLGLVHSLPGVEALLVTRELAIHRSEGFPV